MSIPNIIHQLWIGPKPAPTKLMDSWKTKHPTFEYICWNEQEFKKRGTAFECQSKIDDIEEINGKADIMRWEILYKYGGIFIDADSICVEPLDDIIVSKPCFAGWEQETVRAGLIATGTMGFPPRHPLVKKAIEWIQHNPVTQKEGFMAWQSVGPGLLTRMYNTGRFADLHIFPSYTFLPVHLTGLEYTGHGKIYAYQAWGSTKQSYDTMNALALPSQFNPPLTSISILVSSYNTNTMFVKECLDSIKHQQGLFHMELVWVNDGSDPVHTQILKGLLDHFEKTTRFTKVVYVENETNRGVSYSLNKGLALCSHELVCRMDSDDIMVPDRVQKQLDFMTANPTVPICGGQISMFRQTIKEPEQMTNHKSITLAQYTQNPLHWIANHPTLCYRKSDIIAVGKYDETLAKIEDFELMLRVLKRYQYIHNMKDILLHYRLHDKQVTHNNGHSEEQHYWHNKRCEFIQRIIFNP